MRFHILYPSFILPNDENSICAFTQKARKFSKMMTNHGHTTYFYGHNESDVVCTELVTTLTNQDFIDIYGKIPNWKDPAYVAGSNVKLGELYDKRNIEEISKRLIKNDFLACFWGCLPAYKVLQDKIIIVEPGIGSFNIYAPYCAFESYAVMHSVYGRLGISPRAYDFVVPNYFEVHDDYDLTNKNKSYFLYVGRVLPLKGIEIIIELAKNLPNEKFVIAGPGTLAELKVKIIPDNIQEIGPVNIARRNILMKNAKALILPSLYAEPFGGVVIEAYICGTPVITSDWGVFNETVLHGITGFRARNIDQFYQVCLHIDEISREKCRDWGVNNYSLDAIYPKFIEWFNNLLILHRGGGFYTINKEKRNIDYLNINYPK